MAELTVTIHTEDGPIVLPFAQMVTIGHCLDEYKANGVEPTMAL